MSPIVGLIRLAATAESLPYVLFIFSFGCLLIPLSNGAKSFSTPASFDRSLFTNTSFFVCRVLCACLFADCTEWEIEIAHLSVWGQALEADSAWEDQSRAAGGRFPTGERWLARFCDQNPKAHQFGVKEVFPCSQCHWGFHSATYERLQKQDLSPLLEQRGECY